MSLGVPGGKLILQQHQEHPKLTSSEDQFISVLVLKRSPLFVSFYSRSINLCSFTSLGMSRSQQAQQSSVITLTHARLHWILLPLHTQNIAFRHLPPNSARIGYGTEGAALFISVQLSAGVVNALPKVWVLI